MHCLLKLLIIEVGFSRWCPNSAHTAPAYSSSCGVLNFEVLPYFIQIVYGRSSRPITPPSHSRYMLLVPLCEMYRYDRVRQGRGVLNAKVSLHAWSILVAHAVEAQKSYV